jgi:SNF2 family DNA or RNA helicase
MTRDIRTDSLSALKDILSSLNSRDPLSDLILYNYIGYECYKVEVSPHTGRTTMLKLYESSPLHWNPKPYQVRAIRLLLSQASVGLFLDPGLGKTSICLAAIKILLQKKMIRKVLIIAPLRAIHNTWPDEIKKWEEFRELSFTIVHGSQKAYNVGVPSDITLINSEGLEWLLTATGGTLSQYDVLIIDESSRFKNSQTKRFKMLKPLLDGFARRWILTGTPCPNGLEDLFGQVYILDLGRSLGRFITHFRRDYFHLAGYNLYDWKPNKDAWEKVTEKISPLILQLSAEEYLQMPELVNVTTLVTLPSSIMKVYESLESEYYAKLQDVELVAGSPAIVGQKLRQIANGFFYQEGKAIDVHDRKLQALESILQELGPKPVLILYEFNRDKERICSLIPECKILGGGLSPKEESAIIKGFNDGSITRLAGHAGSMGISLNLQGVCQHVVWFGIPWNLEHYDQAITRVWRQGQTHDHVFVYHIVAKSTKDEEVMLVLGEKDRTQQGLLKRLSAHRRDNYGED